MLEHRRESRIRNHVFRCVLAVVAALVLGGCDSFFVISGTVTRCTDHVALAGVTAHLTLLRGVSDHEEATDTTAADGTFTVVLNEPDTASARLDLSSPGYQSIARDYPSSPGTQQNYCLSPQ